MGQGCRNAKFHPCCIQSGIGPTFERIYLDLRLGHCNIQIVSGPNPAHLESKTRGKVHCAGFPLFIKAEKIKKGFPYLLLAENPKCWISAFMIGGKVAYFNFSGDPNGRNPAFPTITPNVGSVCFRG